MRRICVMVCVLCMVVLCGCKPPETTPKTQVDGFTCRVTAEYNELSLAGVLTWQDKVLTLTPDRPTTLEGLTLTLKDGTLTANWHGISAVVEAAQLPSAGMLPLLCDSLRAAALVGGKRTNEGLLLTGTVEAGEYRLLCDPDTGFPRSLSLPDVPLSVTFSDMAPI